MNEIYITILCYIVSFLIGSLITGIIITLSDKKMIKKIESSYKLSKPSLSVDKRLEFNKDLLSFIDMMIELEVFNEKRFELMLNTDDKKLDIDDVIKTVSTRVFESIKPDVFTSNDNIITYKYLMSYIQKRTFIYAMQYVQNNVADQS